MKDKICECGHKKSEHNQFGAECYKFKHIKGSTYQCVCKCFWEKGREHKVEDGYY